MGKILLITRRGRGPGHPRIQRIAADATDTQRLIEVTTGAGILFNCAAPPTTNGRLSCCR
jgi:hypothetical protein